MVNTVLCTMMADGFKAMADEIEGGKKPEEVPLRIDTRTTRDREEGAPEHNPNEVYHVSLNLTHVHRVN